jgi:hypothetical protein
MQNKEFEQQPHRQNMLMGIGAIIAFIAAAISILSIINHAGKH